MTPVNRHQRDGLGDLTGIVQSEKVRDSEQFVLRIGKESFVMRDDSFLRSSVRQQPAVIDFPEPQTQGIGSAVPPIHRVGDLERVANNENGFERWDETLPKRQGETVTWVLPTPLVVIGETAQEQVGFGALRRKGIAVKGRFAPGRQIPRCAEGIEDFVV
ncbi:MAG: hypothetical protein M3480_03360 [Verrucomicrobiota bacterium]|nr:hypothetical protein [Verrucomicrobiota bacterium]